ncbi:MAG: M17 family peptidase N-terminal domain-containing protein [Candidatus Sulfotelmatobacter sp.]|jgi:hypothetical protein
MRSVPGKVLALIYMVLSVPCALQKNSAEAQEFTTTKPPIAIEVNIPNAAFKTRVLLQSPSETETELQIICQFQSLPENTLHGSLIEINEKLGGFLDKIRQPSLFRGELSETVLVTAPRGTLGAKNLLIIGLGDTQGFTPQRLELVGSVAYTESNRLRVAHPYFAPTILDGGVTKYSTGEVAEEFMIGFLRAARIEKTLEAAGLAKAHAIEDLTFLAGPTHADDTQRGIERALTGAAH